MVSLLFTRGYTVFTYDGGHDFVSAMQLCIVVTARDWVNVYHHRDNKAYIVSYEEKSGLCLSYWFEAEFVREF
ncbi:hypothetical protein ACI01nite_15080 [Acetobacter cibinongensis]|uniref:Uncharacterized protein n=1 Tax=Acetobacter cibinongensis TaxID=146475 RepID=A0A0D6MZ64_9PROT|nr:hypothetical protein Abci_001_058 [Acetobacter cibinongensis]GBQ19754.1 hypothetical protein AA0482_2660 [Acetobacter cibinongensis NRIC 0482]GEL58906.1 hypothetical protein ACI01nite_15080 [Acetobacter cibinongensis]